MRRGLTIVLTAAGLAGFSAAAPAGAQDGSSNPLAVTWEVDAPFVVKPLSVSLNDDAPEIASVPIRMPNLVDPGPSAADGVWRGASYVQDCQDELICEAEAPSRLGLRVRSDGTGGVKFGALVRLGEDLSKPRSQSDASWRFFAAADAHALTWDFDRSDGDSVRLEEDKVLVGDAQLGVSRPLAGGDLAFGYIHREVSTEGASRTEQFGGVTFSLAH
jgi:hypothetical protein